MKVRKTENAQVNEILEYLGTAFSDDGLTLDYVEKPELNGLEIEKQGDRIIINYSQLSYLFRALGIAKENLDKGDFKIKERARFSLNGMMVDCSRNAVISIETLQDVIKQIALMGHNMLMLYTEDTYEIEGEPYFGYMRGRYTIKELNLLDDYAAGFGVTLIPCIQTLAHLNAAVNWRVYKDLTDTGDILLIDDEKTYEFIEKAISSLRKSFKSDRIHIGMDEAHMVGRGKYLDKHGDVDKTELMQRHLNRVQKICQKYGFRPMLWGDMFFRIANNGEYYARGSDYSNLKKCVSDDIDLVYWDYYSLTKGEYENLAAAHKKIANNVVFAGGAWKWTSYAPSLFHSMRVSRLALEACFENGINEVFATLWGDDGNEASLYSVLPVVQLFAEYGFYESFTDEYLAKRFKTCTGGNLKDFELLDLPNFPAGTHSNAESNPSKYLLYQDTLMGLFDKHVMDGFDDYYAETAETLWNAAARNGRYSYLFETLASLCDVLKNKSEVGVKIKNAYHKKDVQELQRIVDKTLPEIIAGAEKFRDAIEKQWFIENKPFGFEIIDVRIAGVIQRTKSARARLKSYLDNRIDRLEELEQERLFFDGQENNYNISCYNWRRIFSPGVFP
jgi:hexosaminidase